MNVLWGINKSSNRLKNIITSLLQKGIPLTAKQIHRRIVQEHQSTITYQGVHKALKELASDEIIINLHREYFINLEWIKRLEIFVQDVKNTYQNQQDFDIQQKGESILDLLDSYHKSILHETEDVDGFPFLEMSATQLTDHGTREPLQKKSNVLNLCQLKQGEGCILLGKSGSGKSTTLRMLTRSIAKRANRIPIMIQLRDYTGEDLVQYIQKSFRHRTGVEPGDDVLRVLLKEGSFVFIMDAFNEASGFVKKEGRQYDKKEAILNMIHKALQKEITKHNVFIITCRTYDDPKHRLPFIGYVLNPLDEIKIETILHNVSAKGLLEAIRKDKKLLDLCSSPIILRMIMESNETTPFTPHETIDVYNQFIENSVETYSEKENLAANLCIEVATGLAYHLVPYGTSIQRRSFEKELEHIQKTIGIAKPMMQKIVEILMCSGILDEHQKDRFSFFHQSLQEYLAAVKLKQIDEKKDVDFDALIESTEWYPVVLFYSSICNDSSKLVESLHKRYRQYKDHEALFHAAKSTIRAKKIKPEIKGRVLQSILSIYTYPDNEFYQHWYNLNTIFHEWDDRDVIQKVIGHLEKAKKDITPRMINLLHHSKGALHKKRMEILARLLQTTNDQHMKYSIVEIFGLQKNMNKVDVLIPLLDDKDPLLACQAAWSLKSMGDPAFTRIEQKKKVKNGEQYLEQLRQSLFPDVLRLLGLDNPDHVRGHAVIELARIDYQKAVPHIIRCLRDDKAIIRYHASYIIPQLNDHDGDFLLRYLHDREVVEKNDPEYQRIMQMVEANGGNENGTAKF